VSSSLSSPTPWPQACLLLLISCLAFSACRAPDPLAPALEGAVRPGQSRSEVRSFLGPPTTIDQSPSGTIVEVFETMETIFGTYGVPDREEALEIRQFSVRYDGDERVQETLFHRGVLEGWTLLYSRSVGPEITSEMLAGVRVGVSTRDELTRQLGSPSLARLHPDGGLRLEWIYDYVEAAAVTPGRIYRSLEVTVDASGRVTEAQSVDRTFPTWRR
jgi:outer membrane protein assembly factor BamE (lipoprotein component of BamABCDE complex)